jgi:hypothetical protein
MSQETTTKRPRATIIPTAEKSNLRIGDPVVGPAESMQEDETSKRIAEMRARRAERGPISNSGMNLKLSVPEDQKDPRFEHRWAVDTAGTGTRIHELRAKDWEVAPMSDAGKDPRNVGLGTTVERFANTKTVSKPDKHILMRKPKEFYEEDKAREAAKIKADEEALRKGNVKDPQGLSGPGSYIPAGGIKIEHGR